MAYIREKEKAQALRSAGESINRIAELLKMKKSTVSFWCRDIALTSAQMHSLKFKQLERARVGSLKAAEIKRAQRLNRVADEKTRGAADLGAMSRRDLFILGIGLYWGEGYKSSNGEFGFTNSNPDIIKTFIAWVKANYGIQPEDFILRVSINATYRAKSSESIRYWSKVAGLPTKQFTKTSFIKTVLKKQYGNNRKYFGTLRIKVRRATNLQRRVLGTLECLVKRIESLQ